MEPIRHVAIICVGRAVLFGSLAIVMLMLAFAFDPVLAFKCGAITTLVMTGILTIKAMYATTKPPKHTEVWLFLEERWRPSNEQSQHVFSSILREVYCHFAKATLTVACGFFVISILLSALGVEPNAFAAR